MEFVIEFFHNFWELANAMSIYILFGLLIASIIKELMPEDLISKHLGSSNLMSVIKATVFGIPMPVCSCSVIPLAKSLEKEGASKGAISSFLVSTPITGIDSILATYSFFGLFFTIYRVFSSIIIAVVVGILENIFDNQSNININIRLNNPFKIETNNIKTLSFSPNLVPKRIQNNDCCSNNCCSSKTKRDKEFIKTIFVYAFDSLFGDIAKSLLIGLILGAIFATFLPKELILSSGENILFSYILVSIISMPIYICATSSLPVGASLFASGLPIGAVFIFLSAGPATNSVTMSLVKDMFGLRGFFIYFLSISILSIIFGAILELFFVNLNLSNYLIDKSEFGILNYLATTLMIGLMIYYIFKNRPKS